MLKYLIVQLDDASASFCHYDNGKAQSRLMPLDVLKKGIVWSMKENLTLQFLYPDYEIPMEYKTEIDKTFHADIVSSTCEDKALMENADVVVFDSFAGINHYPFSKGQSYVFRATMQELSDNSEMLNTILSEVDRINIVLTDIVGLTKEMEMSYAEFLDSLTQKVVAEYTAGHNVQINLLTDRILLDGMNNCNAGDESIALCPDGRFYICPAFYSDKETAFDVGNIEDGLNIRNPQLYKLTHAPICRNCDAFQCRRCVWLNRKTTLEVNTPSREQCVVSHIERNASRNLLSKIREIGTFLPGKEISEIDYLDPFEQII